jgi:hypothetical protein
MKKNTYDFAVRVSVLAVQGALAAMAFVSMPAFADNEPTVEDLTKPKNTLDVGVTNVSSSSFKFGEYNGLEQSGPNADVNFSLKGGGAWDSEDATRYSLTGTNLGLDTRNLKGEFGQQGKFRFNFGYDELLRNQSDTYQTPYLGNGTNNLTLPTNWLVPTVPALSATGVNARGLSSAVAASPAVVAGHVVAPTAANLATSATLIGTDGPDFHNVNLATKRSRTDAGFDFNIDPQWDVKVSARREDKDGLQPMGTVSRQGAGATQASTEISTIIANPIKTTTDQFNASLNYTGDKSFMTAAYYGSLFKNAYPTVSWQGWAGTTTAPNTISSAPDNQFHQLSVTGGYNFDRTTKLVVDASYGRSTQNQAFYQDSGTPYVPVSSLNGLVVTESLSGRLTLKPIKDLNVAAGYKFYERDDRTPVNTYAFYDDQNPISGTATPSFIAALGLPAGSLGSGNINFNANRPYSQRVNQFNLDGDYTIVPGEKIKLGAESQQKNRYCNGTWIDCVNADSSRENTGRFDWNGNWAEAGVNAHIGYAYSTRNVTQNSSAWLALVPMANVVPTGQTISAYQAMQLSGLSGEGPWAGYNGGAFAGTGLTAAQAAFFYANNGPLANGAYGNANRISELPGLTAYDQTNRDRNKLRASINWQASDKLSLTGSGSYTKDNYYDSTYGLQGVKNLGLTLEGAYALNEDVAATLYYTYEKGDTNSAGNSFGSNSNALNVNGATEEQ